MRAQHRTTATRRRAALAAILVIALGAFGPASAAFALGGGVTAWGTNDHGELNVPGGLDDVVQVAAGLTHSLALRSDGTVVAWGSGYFSTADLNSATTSEATVPAGLSNVVQVAAGDGHSVALRADGTVVAWGRDDSSQSLVPAGLADVVQIAAGGQHNLALHADGTVSAWGWNDWGQLDLPAGLSDVVQIAAGTHHNLALHRDGSITSWGRQDHGQATTPAGLGEVVLITAGLWHSVALLADGTVRAWGLDNDGQSQVPSGMAPAIRIAAGLQNSAAVHADGSLSIWGTDAAGQSTVPEGLGGVSEVAIGRYHVVALFDPDAATLAIAGSPEPGATVTAAPAHWPGSGGTVSYQWYRDGSAITGATGESYTIAEEDAEATILVRALSTAAGAPPLVSSPVSVAPLTAADPDAPEEPGSEPADEGGTPWPVIIGAIVLLLLVVSIVVGLRTRKGKRDDGGSPRK